MKTESEAMEEDGFDAPRSNFGQQRELSFALKAILVVAFVLVVIGFAVSAA